MGLPVVVEPGADRRNFHYGEVGLDANGELVTSGLYGWTMVVTGTGDTVAAAKRAAYRHVDQVFIPNARYRLDIGDRLMGGELDRVDNLGLRGASRGSLAKTVAVDCPR